MAKIPIKILNSKDVKNFSSSDITCFNFDVLGKTLQFCCKITEEQARLADIVPLARMVSDKILELVLERVKMDGDFVPCQKGCSACCSYLVPISVPEALMLREEIITMPFASSEHLQDVSISTARHLLKHPSSKLFTNPVNPTAEIPLNSLVESQRIAGWYAGLKLSCPFLSAKECLIYSKRPFGCREYFVKGSARACKGKRGSAEVINMPTGMTTVLSCLTGELEGTEAEAIMMPLALPWYEENKERDMKTWPTTLMVKRFFEIVEENM